MKKILSAALFFIFCGCATSSVQMISGKRYKEKSANCSLDVFKPEEKVQRPFHGIAIITYKTSQSPEAILQELKEQTCRVGADGLVVRKVQPGFGEAVAIKY